MSNLVQKIEELCNKKNITFYNLEQALGFGNGTIRRWNDNIPKTDRLTKVADYFNVSIDYLLDRDTTTPPQVLVLQRAADAGLDDNELNDILSYAKFKYPEKFK